MSRRARTIGLGLASATSLGGGAVWLLFLLRAEPPDPTLVHLASGETLTIEYEPGDTHHFSRAERRAVEEVSSRAYPDVRRALPDAPPSLILKIASSKEVLAETGENGTNALPNIVHWGMDPDRPEGVEGIVRSQLRATLFHEVTHLVRAGAIQGGRLRDRALQEGLATAVERDFGGSPDPPWGRYPPDVSSWAKELLSLPDAEPAGPWLGHHPDGRRWIAGKVGTWLVDCAGRKSGRTSASLVRTPTDAIVETCLAE